MRRVLFRLRGVPIYSYPAMLYLGIVLGIYAELFAAASIGLSLGRTLATTLVLLVVALLGARLLFVWQHWHQYANRPTAIWRFEEGGAALHGGLLLAVPCSLVVLPLARLPFGAFWDVASFTLLIGLMVTRVGCLLNGCCSGRPTQGWLALHLPDHRGVWQRRIPVQILEMAWGGAVLAGALVLWRRLPFPGALFAYVVGAYGAGRFVLEGWRDDEERVMGVRLHRAIALAFAASAIVVFVLAR